MHFTCVCVLTCFFEVRNFWVTCSCILKQIARSSDAGSVGVYFSEQTYLKSWHFSRIHHSTDIPVSQHPAYAKCDMRFSSSNWFLKSWDKTSLCWGALCAPVWLNQSHRILSITDTAVMESFWWAMVNEFSFPEWLRTLSFNPSFPGMDALWLTTSEETFKRPFRLSRFHLLSVSA